MWIPASVCTEQEKHKIKEEEREREEERKRAACENIQESLAVSLATVVY